MRRGLCLYIGMAVVYRGSMTHDRPDDGSGSSAEQRVRTCPNCGRTLTGRSCRLVCPDPACGFYLSCSDYY